MRSGVRPRRASGNPRLLRRSRPLRSAARRLRQSPARFRSERWNHFRLLTTDTDPALNLDFWLSAGSAHVWNPEQRTPATARERTVDALMNEVATSHDQMGRKAQFAEV